MDTDTTDATEDFSEMTQDERIDAFRTLYQNTRYPTITPVKESH
nr:hypothetical protein [Rhodococcus sp. (in: high G+C Gram-positive bacteria)]